IGLKPADDYYRGILPDIQEREKARVTPRGHSESANEKGAAAVSLAGCELAFLASGGVAPARKRYRFAPRELWVWRHKTFLAITALTVFLTYAFVGEAAVVPTGSMEGTILIGDH